MMVLELSRLMGAMGGNIREISKEPAEAIYIAT